MNIEDYEFDDVDIELENHKNNHCVSFKVEYKCHVTEPNEYAYMYLSKDDAITLAKHFKLTTNDLSEEP